MKRGWRFCRLNGIVNRVISCWSLVGPAVSSCLVFGRYWTTSGLQPNLRGAWRENGFRSTITACQLLGEHLPRPPAQATIRTRTRPLALTRAAPNERRSRDETHFRTCAAACRDRHLGHSHLRSRLLLRMGLEIRAQRPHDRESPTPFTRDAAASSCNSRTSAASPTPPIATSAIRPSRRRSSVPLAGCGRTRSGCRTWTRRALDTSEIPGVTAQYAQATTNALAAGFDGVEPQASPID